MNQSVDGRHRRHRILKDFVPLAEDQVGAHQHAASFITLGKEGEGHQPALGRRTADAPCAGHR